MNIRKVLVLMLCLVVLSLSFSCVSAGDYSVEKNAIDAYNNQPFFYMVAIKKSGVMNNTPISIEEIYGDNEGLLYLFVTNASLLMNTPLDGINPDLTFGDMFGINNFLFENYFNNIEFSM